MELPGPGTGPQTSIAQSKYMLQARQQQHSTYSTERTATPGEEEIHTHKKKHVRPRPADSSTYPLNGLIRLLLVKQAWLVRPSPAQQRPRKGTAHETFCRQTDEIY